MEKKRATQIKPVIDMENATITFNIADGKPAIVLDMTKVHQDNVNRAAYVGFAQVRIVDTAAISKEGENGKIRTPDEMMALKREAIQAAVDHYETGTDQWSRKSSGTGQVSMVIQALMRLKSVATVADTKAMVQAYADRNYEGNYDEALEFLGSAPKVQEMIATIQRERLPEAKIDADAGLDELMAE